MAAVELDRQSIEKRDFPIGRRGYDPAAVDAHLRALADRGRGAALRAGKPRGGDAGVERRYPGAGHPRGRRGDRRRYRAESRRGRARRRARRPTATPSARARTRWSAPRRTSPRSPRPQPCWSSASSRWTVSPPRSSRACAPVPPGSRVTSLRSRRTWPSCTTPPLGAGDTRRRRTPGKTTPRQDGSQPAPVVLEAPSAAAPVVQGHSEFVPAACGPGRRRHRRASSRAAAAAPAPPLAIPRAVTARAAPIFRAGERRQRRSRRGASDRAEHGFERRFTRGNRPLSGGALPAGRPAETAGRGVCRDRGVGVSAVSQRRTSVRHNRMTGRCR